MFSSLTQSTAIRPGVWGLQEERQAIRSNPEGMGAAGLRALPLVLPKRELVILKQGAILAPDRHNYLRRDGDTKAQDGKGNGTPQGVP